MKELGRVKGRTPSVFMGLSLKDIAAGWWTTSRLLQKLLVPAGVLQAVQHFHGGPGLMLCGCSVALTYACLFLLSESHSAHNLPLFQITQISPLGFRNLGLQTVLRARGPVN